MTGDGGSAGGAAPALALDEAALARLMPLHMWLDGEGDIRSIGPTLEKVIGRGPLRGRPFLDLFILRTPRCITTQDDLARLPGTRLRLQLRQPPATALRGLAVALPEGGGLLLNLSFGIGVTEAVRSHGLTDADFAPTDLAVELLYLVEAKAPVLEELRRLNLRLKGAMADAERQAVTDALTGLGNRRAMEQALAQLLRGEVPLALMHLDLDYFKNVNDTLGHAAGDHVLCVIAQILRDEVRHGDIVTRVGGDEFVLIFPNVSDYGPIRGIGKRILKRLASPIGFQGRECRISGSIGATLSAFYARPGIDRLLQDADRALYASKRRGRARLTTVPAPPEFLRDGRGVGGR